MAAVDDADDDDYDDGDVDGTSYSEACFDGHLPF
jgi:hypothetical protein